MEDIPKHDVIIVGSGPSGLAMAIELGSRGVDCLLIERNDRVGYAPRAKTTNVRTRTHLRRWGIAEDLAAASPFGTDYPSDIKFVTRLAGAELATIENASNCSPVRDERYPEHGQWVPQYKLEQVMREQADHLFSVTLRFGTELVSATQGEMGAELLLRDVAGGGEWKARCAYAIGADGARSRLRDVIGATMHGRYGLSRNYNIVFRAPGLREAHGHGDATMYWQVNPVAPSLIGPMDKDDVWFFMPTRLPDGFTITQDSAAALIREATGIDLPYEILSSDEWVASSLIADRYRDGRIFLIGDACHLHPPFGGYGMNMGVADGVDLGWKLAAMLQGWGGAALLDSYETERRKIHAEVIAEAEANHAVLSNDFWADGLDDQDEAGATLRAAAGDQIRLAKKREFHTLGTVLGGCYVGSPIIADDSAAKVPVFSDRSEYVPSSRPGCLAPHLWLADGRSLYDAFGADFTLLATETAAVATITEIASTFRRAGVPLAIVNLEPGAAVALYPRRLTLVRPDQHIAWRGDRWREDVIDIVTGQRTVTDSKSQNAAEAVQ